jgi:hypothetical protein
LRAVADAWHVNPAFEAVALAAYQNAESQESVLNATMPTGISLKTLATVWRRNLKKLSLIALLFVFCLAGRFASAQQFDAAFGVSTLSSASGTTTGGLYFPTEGGGAYPTFSADFLLRHRLGVEGEVSWRASQNLYAGSQPYRPVFYAFNAIWAPKLTKYVTAEMMAGIGGESLRFYTGSYNCNFFGCTTYVSANHFMGDVGGGIRAYFWRNAFIRPEVRVYLVNNNQEFSSGNSVRYGMSLGYSFGGR